MILNLLVLAISATAWVTALWLFVLPRMAAWPDLVVAAAHAGPPIVATLLWIFLRRRRQRIRAAEAQARDESVEAERSAARSAAQKAYDDEMLQRRLGCDCRMLVLSRVGLPTSAPLPDPGLPNVEIRPIELDAIEVSDNSSLLEQLGPAIHDALCAIYSACQAALVFPIYVQPPAELSGEEVLAYLRKTRAAIADQFAANVNPCSGQPPILFLPGGDSVPNSVLSLFETCPEMPGAIILAFDSPHARTRTEENDFDEEPDAHSKARERLVGKPSEAVVALLVTNAGLPSILAAISPALDVDVADSMTPFWDKEIHADAGPKSLSRLSSEVRTELAELPVLGRIHRAALRRPSARRGGILELTRTVQDALEHAQINAGLIAPPFAFNGELAEPTEQFAENTGETCAAIVHNAGGVEEAGRRLAALGSALYYFNIDLSPVDKDAALNVVSRIGDAGRATGISQLALALVYAASEGAPALCAEFLDSDSIAASFVMPPASNQQ